MIEFKCSQCGKQLRVKDEAAGKRGKCPQCAAIFQVPNATPTPAFEPEIDPPNNAEDGATVSSSGVHSHQSESSGTRRAASQVAEGESGKQFDQPTKIAMGAGSLGLLILALSPLFKWITIGGGGFTGISGDGKIVFGVTVVAGIVYAASVFTRERLIAVSLGVGAWGTVALFWMGGLIWKVASIIDSPDVKGNPFATIFATQITPGTGLYLGLFGGLIVAASLGYMGFQDLRQRDRLWLFCAVQTGALLLGVLVAVAMVPERGKAIDGSDVEVHRQPPRNQQLSKAELAARRTYAKMVMLRDVRASKSVLGEQGVFGEIKNTGERTLSEVEITVHCLDAEGRPVSEDTFHPVHEGASSWSTRSYMPLRPNYAQAFGFKVESTSDWTGRVRVEVTDIDFADEVDATIPVRNDPHKQAYLPKIELRDVRKGESALGEVGIFGEVKNAGTRTLTKVEIVIYCLDDSGHRVFEKRYHPVLVSDSSWSMDPDKPLKPNYYREVRLQNGRCTFGLGWASGSNSVRPRLRQMIRLESVT